MSQCGSKCQLIKDGHLHGYLFLCFRDPLKERNSNKKEYTLSSNMIFTLRSARKRCIKK